MNEIYKNLKLNTLQLAIVKTILEKNKSQYEFDQEITSEINEIISQCKLNKFI